MPNLPEDNFVNFFWTGKLPGNKSFKHLFQWQSHLHSQDSDFKVRLWVTADLYESMRADPKYSSTPDGSLITGEPPNQVYIKNFDPLLNEARSSDHYPKLVELYTHLINAKLFSFASSFARMLILDSYPGFYSDFDMQPNSAGKFAKSMDQLRESIPANDNTMKNYAFNYSNGLFIENQVMLSLMPGAFSEKLKGKNNQISNDPLFVDVEKLIQVYKLSILKLKELIDKDPNFYQNNQEYIGNFKNNMTNALLSELRLVLKDEKDIEKIDQSLNLFQSFYRLSIRGYDYERAKETYPMITQAIQSCFQNPTQDKKVVYAWSHPIHFRLEKLKNAANTIGNIYSATKEDKYARENAQKNAKKTLLKEAAKIGNEGYIKKNYNTLTTEEISKLFEVAASHNQWKVVEFLLTLKEAHKVNWTSRSTVIDKAIHSENPEVMKNLCNINSDDFVLSILNSAAGEGKQEWVSYLLTNRKNIMNEKHMTEALDKAIQYYHYNIVETLINADETLKTKALNSSIISQRWNIVESLLQADKSLKPDEDLMIRALCLLARYGRFQLIEQLVPNGKLKEGQLEPLISDAHFQGLSLDWYRHFLTHNQEQVTQAMVTQIACLNIADKNMLGFLFDTPLPFNPEVNIILEKAVEAVASWSSVLKFKDFLAVFK